MAAPAPAGRGPIFRVALLLLAVVLAVYGDSLSGAFVFDDLGSIPQNPTIRHLWPLSIPLAPPHGDGATVNGRPLLNLSFALNYALSGYRVWSYHAVNVAIHFAAALLLFGIVRRTFLRPVLAARYGGRALFLGAAAALLWMVHPMQTESVAYVVQRAESLVGFFYLLTLYAFIRSVEEGPCSRRWFGLSVAACFLGMAVKEVMVTAPVMILLYDRTFVAGTFREAWRRRGGRHLALAAAWLLLAWLMIGSQERGGTAGFSLPIPWWAYALRQFQSVLEYLRLIVWPHPLIFDAFTYNSIAQISDNLWEVIPSALVIVPLLAATAWAVWKKPALGFLGAWFFVILTPSSSVVPVTDLVWEHRVYLSLAAPVVLGLAGLVALEKRWGWRAWIPVACLALAWGALAAWRNLDYRSALALWSRNISRVPENAASHNNLGLALLALHRRDEAEAEFQAAIRCNPSLIVGYSNLGDLYLQEGRNAAAIQELQIALRLQPGNAEIHTTLGGALLHFGRPEEADRELGEALRLRPGFPLAWYELGNLRLRQGRVAEAVAAYRKVLRGNPGDPRAHNSLGVALAQSERLAEAEAEFRASLRLDPINPNAHYNLGNTLLLSNRRAEAAAEFQETLRLAPAHAAARAALEGMR